MRKYGVKETIYEITMPTVFIVTHAKENKHSLSFARTMVLTLFKRVNK